MIISLFFFIRSLLYGSPLYFIGVSPFSIHPKVGESLQPGDYQDSVFSPTSPQFDFSPCNLDQLQEEDQETFR